MRSLPRILPRKLLEWREPRAVRRALDEIESRELSPWFKPLFVLGVATFFMGMWGLSHLNPAKHPPALPHALAASLGIGLFLTYVVPWMIALCPSIIVVYEKKLVRHRGNSALETKGKNILGYSFSATPDSTLLVLRIRAGKRETERIFALPDATLIPQVREALDKIRQP